MLDAIIDVEFHDSDSFCSFKPKKEEDSQQTICLTFTLNRYESQGKKIKRLRLIMDTKYQFFQVNYNKLTYEYE